MWNTSCSNKICFTQDKTYEQNLHLKRLFCVRPEINVTRPFSPKFLEIRAPQKEKRRQVRLKKLWHIAKSFFECGIRSSEFGIKGRHIRTCSASLYCENVVFTHK